MRVVFFGDKDFRWMEPDGELMDGDCGCPKCDEGVQPGHSGCKQSTPELLEAEAAGLLRRQLDINCWAWLSTTGRGADCELNCPFDTGSILRSLY